MQLNMVFLPAAPSRDPHGWNGIPLTITSQLHKDNCLMPTNKTLPAMDEKFHAGLMLHCMLTVNITHFTLAVWHFWEKQDFQWEKTSSAGLDWGGVERWECLMFQRCSRLLHFDDKECVLRRKIELTIYFKFIIFLYSLRITILQSTNRVKERVDAKPRNESHSRMRWDSEMKGISMAKKNW